MNLAQNVWLDDFKVMYIFLSSDFLKFLYAHLKNGTYYVTGYGVRPSVNFFISG